MVRVNEITAFRNNTHFFFWTMLYKILLLLMARRCINMTLRATEMSGFTGRIRWSSCSFLEGEKDVVPLAVQARAVKTVLKVHLFLEFDHYCDIIRHSTC